MWKCFLLIVSVVSFYLFMLVKDIIKESYLRVQLAQMTLGIGLSLMPYAILLNKLDFDYKQTGLWLWRLDFDYGDILDGVPRLREDLLGVPPCLMVWSSYPGPAKSILHSVANGRYTSRFNIYASICTATTNGLMQDLRIISTVSRWIP